MTADREVLAEILSHRDALLRAVQEFLNALNEDDVHAFSPEQRDLLKDVALYAGCTNLPWWNAKVETPVR